MASEADARKQRRAQQERQRAAKTESRLTSSATKFLVVRHGETDWNAEHRLQGQKDPPLNALGLRQAASLASRLAQDAQFATIYSSDLDRAATTAASISSATNIDVTLAPAFRERGLGVLEGLTSAEARQQQPAAWAALECGDPLAGLPGGESLVQVEQRAADGVEEIAARHPGQCVALVTHGGVLQVLYRHATGREFNGRLKNCAINTLWIDGNGWHVGEWGDDTHLQDVGVQKEAFGGGLGG